MRGWFAFVLMAVGFTGHAMYSSVRTSAARAAVEVAADSVETLLALRVPMEAREDSLRSVVKAQAEALRTDSVRSARDLERADRRARVATVRASSLADSIRVRVDSATALVLDSLLIEHHVEVVALTRQIEIFRSENAALWGNRRSLDELVAAADSVNSILRFELGQKDLQIAGLTRLASPPFTLRFFRSAKLAIPMLALGYGLGVVTSG